MNDFKFVSEEYSIKKSENYRLSIQLNPDGFSVLVTNEVRKVLKILHIQTGSFENSHRLLKTREDLIKLRELSFKSVLILLNNERVSLVPDIEDYKNKRWNYFYSDFIKINDSRIISTPIKNYGISCNFEVDSVIHGLVSSFRNKPSVKHISTYILENNLSCSKNKKCARIYSSPGLIHISLAENQNLEFYNVFTWATEEEMLFHLMNVLRKFSLDEVTVEYSGHIKKNGNSLKLLKKYIPKLIILPNAFSFEIAWDVYENYFGYLYPETIADN